MNSLSLIIYLISLIDGMSHYTTGLLILSGTITVISFVGVAISQIIVRSIAFGPEGDSDAKAWMDSGYLSIAKICKISFIIWLLVSIASVVIPNKQYAVMIAASEIGERVLETDQAKKFATDITGLSAETTDLLRTYIQQQTIELKGQIAKTADDAASKVVEKAKETVSESTK